MCVCVEVIVSQCGLVGFCSQGLVQQTSLLVHEVQLLVFGYPFLMVLKIGRRYLD